MRMISVESSNIAKIGHDPATKELRIEFRNGGVYSHAGVEREAYEALMQAQSKGAHYAQHVRAKYPHRKMEVK